MLQAYFDDSGTNSDSEIVLVGGIFGFPNQMDLLSGWWSKKLADPSPGKLPLRRFHMAQCEAADGEFAGWRREATDFLVHELGDFILKTGVYGFAAAIERRPYEEMVTGDLRRACGDPETFCYIQCFNRIRQFAHEFLGASDIALVFDSRPSEKQSDVRQIHEVYTVTNRHEKMPEFVSLTFASSVRLLPLQAADMIAWEFYQDSLDTIHGRRIEDGFRRKQLERLVKGGRLRSELLDREGIKRMVREALGKEYARHLRVMADAVNFG